MIHLGLIQKGNIILGQILRGIIERGGGGSIIVADALQWLTGLEADALTLYDELDVVNPEPQLRDPNCLESTGAQTMTNANISSGAVVTNLGTATGVATAGLITWGAGTISHVSLDGVLTYVCSEGGEAFPFDVSVNDNHITAMTTTWTTQDGFASWNDSDGFKYVPAVSGKVEDLVLDQTHDYTSLQSNATSIAFSPDGLNIYVASNGNDDCKQFSLAAAFDISNPTLVATMASGIFNNGHCYGLWFNEDGTRMYSTVSNYSATVRINQYDLSTGWDVSTGTFATQTNLANPEGSFPADVQLSKDGTKLFHAFRTTTSLIRQYDLATPFELSSVGTVQSEVSAVSGNSVFKISDSGMTLYLRPANAGVRQYPLTTAWDITTKGAQESSKNPPWNFNGWWIDADTEKFIVNNTGDVVTTWNGLNEQAVDAYRIPAKADGSAAADGSAITNPGGKVSNDSECTIQQSSSVEDTAPLNIIRDPGFVEGIGNWTFNLISGTCNVTWEGSNSIKMAGSGSGVTAQIEYELFPPEVGKAYYIEIDVVSSAGTQANTIYLGGTLVAGQSSGVDFPTAGAPYTLAFTTPVMTGTDPLIINIDGYAPALQLDNISATPITGYQVPQIAVNGEFVADTNWSKYFSMSIPGNGTCVWSASPAGTGLIQYVLDSLPFVVGTDYELEIDLASITGGVTLRAGGVTTPTITASGVHAYTVTAVDTGVLGVICAVADTACVINSVSAIKKGVGYGIFGGTSLWGDTTSWDKVPYADLHARYLINGWENLWIEEDENGAIVQAKQWPVHMLFTQAEANQNLTDFGTGGVPLYDQYGLPVLDNLGYIVYTS